MRVLFLCVHNSARSQMAEALLRDLTHGQVDVCSAGTEPRGVHPLAVRVLEESGVPHAGRSKHLEEFRGQAFDFVITTCDEAQEACPQWPGAQMIHWKFPDPAAAPPDQQLAAFQRTRNELRQRIRLFVQANSLPGVKRV
jgi:protein-tyrosine-phosphatase